MFTITIILGLGFAVSLYISLTYSPKGENPIWLEIVYGLVPLTFFLFFNSLFSDIDRYKAKKEFEMISLGGMTTEEYQELSNRVMEFQNKIKEKINTKIKENPEIFVFSNDTLPENAQMSIAVANKLNRQPTIQDNIDKYKEFLKAPSYIIGFYSKKKNLFIRQSWSMGMEEYIKLKSIDDAVLEKDTMLKFNFFMVYQFKEKEKTKKNKQFANVAMGKTIGIFNAHELTDLEGYQFYQQRVTLNLNELKTGKKEQDLRCYDCQGLIPLYSDKFDDSYRFYFTCDNENISFEDFNKYVNILKNGALKDYDCKNCSVKRLKIQNYYDK